jgi:hypothetical protein
MAHAPRHRANPVAAAFNMACRVAKASTALLDHLINPSQH